MKSTGLVLVLVGGLASTGNTIAAEKEKVETHDWFASMLWRYENETGSIGIKDRERIRLIANAGVKSKWSDNWSSTLRISTGLKNKQNVPAITMHRFTEQPQPDNDIFIDRAFVTGKFDKVKVNIGKIPWGSKQITDIFWDRHLNPIGVSSDWTIAKGHKLHLAHFQPLDGASDTIGDMFIVQWQAKFKAENFELGLMPWWVKYDGESGAEYATRDTHLDNDFFRLSAYVKSGKWRLGTDIGIGDIDKSQVAEEFADEDTSVAVELRHGGLKKVDSVLTQFRVFRVERYSVVTEFAQNAVARYATSNIKGWDLRVRKKLAKNWWLGIRYSDTETLVGNKQEGKRFRIETKYSF